MKVKLISVKDKITNQTAKSLIDCAKLKSFRGTKEESEKQARTIFNAMVNKIPHGIFVELYILLLEYGQTCFPKLEIKFKRNKESEN
jgi:hypothetical protein